MPIDIKNIDTIVGAKIIPISQQMVVKVTLHVIQWIVEIFSIFGFRKRKSFKPQGVMQDERSLIAAVEFLSNHGTFTYSVA